MFKSEIDNVSQKSQDLDTYSDQDIEKEMAKRGLSGSKLGNSGSL